MTPYNRNTTDHPLTRMLQDHAVQMAFAASILADALPALASDDDLRTHLTELASLNQGVLAGLQALLSHLELTPDNARYLPSLLDKLAVTLRAQVQLDLHKRVVGLPATDIQQTFFRVACLALYDLSYRDEQPCLAELHLHANDAHLALYLTTDEWNPAQETWQQMVAQALHIGGRLSRQPNELSLVWGEDGPYGPDGHIPPALEKNGRTP